MADERTMSAVTMINTAQRNRQKVNVVMALTQVRAFYFVQNKPRVRTFSLSLSLPIPAIRSSLSNSSTLSGCFVPLTMMRAKRRQEERGTTMNRRTSICVPPRLRRVLCCLLMRTTKLNLCSDELPERHPPLKRSLASCEWGRKWIGPLCVGDQLRLVGLPKRFRLLLPFGQKSIAPMAHLGRPMYGGICQPPRKFSSCTLSSQELFTYFTCLISGLVKN